MGDFATYILNEENYIQKMIIAYYMSQKTGIFFNKSIVLRTEILRMFLNYASLDVNENEVLTAMLLCNCKKVDDVQKIGRLKTYAKEGAEYLSLLGFDKRFCKICEGVNRYTISENREKESDILELVDQFTGLILKRPEREGFTPEEALIILKERNLKGVNNRYLEDFKVFVKAMQNVYIRETIDVPVIKKLTSLCEKESDVKKFISKLGNRYSSEIDKIMGIEIKKKSEELFKVEKEPEQNKAKETMKKVHAAHRYTRKIVKSNAEKSLFSKEAAERILNHQSIYKIED